MLWGVLGRPAKPKLTKAGIERVYIVNIDISRILHLMICHIRRN